jgi:SAM-dependent methyltransferase
VADDTHDRILSVNRAFTAPALVSPFPEVWAALLPGAKAVPDDPVLALEPGAHDLVVHDLCLHWAEDPLGQLVQSARALRPDGLLLATLFAGTTLADLRAALAEAEVEATGGLSPRILPFGEIRDLGGLLGRAGLALPVADATPFTLSYPDAWALMRDLRAMGEGNALAGRLRRPTRRDVLLAAAARYPLTDGRALARFEVVTLTAFAPAPSQPKALRPGSATRSLAEALEEAKKDPGERAPPDPPARRPQ